MRSVQRQTASLLGDDHLPWAARSVVPATPLSGFGRSPPCRDDARFAAVGRDLNYAGKQEAATTVFLVDDDEGVVDALSRLLKVEGYDVRASQSAREFFSEHDASVPGCGIIDITLPDCNGLEIQERLAREGIERPVIFLTGTADIAASVQAMKAGAVDFLTKPVQSEHLLAAIRRAIQQDADMRQAREIRAAVDKLLATLTPREREVLMHVIVGRLNKQIAGDLGTVEKTIKVHRSRMMAKLGVRNLAGLFCLARRAGLVADT